MPEPDDKHAFAMNPWHPITNPVTLKHTGKLQEELGELISAISRCVIQGVDEADPVTGRVNRQWLQEEIADVLCGIELLTEHLGLDERAISKRSDAKQAKLRTWHKMA